jgi:hypothetical protein
MKNVGCAAIALLFIALGLVEAAVKNPWVWLFITALVGVLIWANKVQSKRKVSTDKASHLRNIQLLESIASNLPSSVSSGLALKKGEVVVYRLDEVGLVEYRSNGSSYSGGSQGFSFRIMKGVSYRVGANRGAIVKNPETPQMVDEGSATFTNQRVVFAGANQSREWEFEKFLDTNVSANGVTAYMSVSNRQKTSGLTWTNKNDLTPGLVLAVANDYFEGGLDAAKQRCRETANEIKALLQLPLGADVSDEAERTGHKSEVSETPNADLAVGPSFEVVGETFYRANFDTLRVSQKLELRENGPTIATLVAEPNNQHSRNGKAVSVQVDGLVLGHIPEASNTKFFDILVEHGGTATCLAELYLDPEAGEDFAKNSVRLLVAFPPKLSN